MIPCLSVNSHTFNPLKSEPVSPQLVAETIAFVIDTARNQGQTLEDLVKEILAEDQILEQPQRRWLSNIIIQAWKNLPVSETNHFSIENYFKSNYDESSSQNPFSTSQNFESLVGN